MHFGLLYSYKITILSSREHDDREEKKYEMFVQGEASHSPRLMTGNVPTQQEDDDITQVKQRAQADGRFNISLLSKELEKMVSRDSAVIKMKKLKQGLELGTVNVRVYTYMLTQNPIGNQNHLRSDRITRLTAIGPYI